MRGYGGFGFVIVVLALGLGFLTRPVGSGPDPVGVSLETYANFEGTQTHPIALDPSGTRLFVVNTADARLSVFDLSTPAAPRLLTEIPVGIEPVSVRARSDDEAWVVNQISDSVSIVSVSRGIVVDTLPVKDEPADLVFVGHLAFVTVARSNMIRVFDVASHAPVASILLQGENPRAIAASPDGRRVYAAFALSGNRTTIVPAAVAPPPPSPTNPNLPPAPPQGLIVDAADPSWQDIVRYTLADHDVAEIDAATLTVSRYFSGVGTINLGLAVRPTTGDVFVANTDARNLVRFESSVRGHLVDNRVTRITVADGLATPFDLNPTVDYRVLPNPAARAIALAQPTAIVFESGGNVLYVAAFGTDRIARLDANGNVIDRIEVGPATGTGASADPRRKRGPRGLALHPSQPYLYVLNRISNTLVVIDTAATPPVVVAETGVGRFLPTPAVIRNGRGFLYDAKLSGNGTAACAACHVDADMDLLAWDLGDPGGAMQAVPAVPTSPLRTVPLHPMKGPMMTQTLRGLAGLEPLHWRGDRADFVAFNHAFDTLMGGADLPAGDMVAFRDFVNSLRFPPNPNQNLDRTLPPSVAGGDPTAGRDLFLHHKFPFLVPNQDFKVSCSACHTAYPPGTKRVIFPGRQLHLPQPFKTPQLRSFYQKHGFQNQAGAINVRGFGFSTDGAFGNVFDLLSRPFFGDLASNPIAQANLNAYLLTFDTGTAPAVGYTRTIGPAQVSATETAADWRLLEGQAALGHIDLIAKGTVDGRIRGLLYRPGLDDYVTDRTGLGPFTRAELQAKIAAGDILSLMGVPPGSGLRMGIDRDLDGRYDGD
jgi:DNA-binding beta-propeller fold protein YncE